MADNPVGQITGSNVNTINQARVNDVLRRTTTGASFESLLKEQLIKNQPLQFSKHAQERIGQRGIEISPTLLNSLEQAVSKARDKGARDIVILSTNSAFIVNVPNNTVVTTMSGGEMKDNIFTNIDSAVII